MSLQVISLAGQLLSRDLRKRVGGPDLAVGVRIAGPHDGAAIFEDLHVVDLRHLSQLLELSGPGADHTCNLCGRHGGQGKIVAGREADYPANAGFAFGDQQSPVFEVEAIVANPQLERRKVIFENEGSGVSRIKYPSRPGISRAKIAGGVIFGLAFGRNLLDLPLPRPTGAMWGNQHSLVGEGVQSAMRIFSKLQ